MSPESECLQEGKASSPEYTVAVYTGKEIEQSTVSSLLRDILARKYTSPLELALRLKRTVVQNPNVVFSLESQSPR